MQIVWQCHRHHSRHLSSLSSSSSSSVAFAFCRCHFLSKSPFIAIVVLYSFVNVIIHHSYLQHPSTFVRLSGPLPSTDIHLLSFIPVDTPYFSNHMYVFFKIVYRFLKIICTSTYFCINTYIYIFCINTYIYVSFVLIHTFT
jgi:hypothetical protein